MLIKTPEQSTHWYLPTGEPFYTVPKKDGTGDRPTTIRDAFKAGAYRSVTNVIGVLAKPGLDYWKREQVVLASLTLPRIEGETEHNFAERVIVDADEQARKARDAGTRLHELAAGWLVSGRIPAPASEAVLLAPFQAWCQSNLFPVQGLVQAPESVMVNHSLGYAGRLDLPVRMLDGSIAIIDCKTQDVKRDGKDQPKPEYYDEWQLQLAAYSRCSFADGSFPSPQPWRQISLVIDRQRPGCYTKEWTNPVAPWASSEPAFDGFAAACAVWSFIKGGTPGIDKEAA